VSGRVRSTASANRCERASTRETRYGGGSRQRDSAGNRWNRETRPRAGGGRSWNQSQPGAAIRDAGEGPPDGTRWKAGSTAPGRGGGTEGGPHPQLKCAQSAVGPFWVPQTPGPLHTCPAFRVVRGASRRSLYAGMGSIVRGHRPARTVAENRMNVAECEILILLANPLS
jgi:hypothetical protein